MKSRNLCCINEQYISRELMARSVEIPNGGLVAFAEQNARRELDTTLK
jgi:hypothetical protein